MKIRTTGKMRQMRKISGALTTLRTGKPSELSGLTLHDVYIKSKKQEFKCPSCTAKGKIFEAMNQGELVEGYGLTAMECENCGEIWYEKDADGSKQQLITEEHRLGLLRGAIHDQMTMDEAKELFKLESQRKSLKPEYNTFDKFVKSLIVEDGTAIFKNKAEQDEFNRNPNRRYDYKLGKVIK